MHLLWLHGFQFGDTPPPCLREPSTPSLHTSRFITETTSKMRQALHCLCEAFLLGASSFVLGEAHGQTRT